MRVLLRTATIIGGAAAIAVVVLLAIAAGSGTWAPAIVAAVLAVATIIAAMVVAMRVVDNLVSRTDRTATRLKNAETRAAGIVDRAAELETLVTSRFEKLELLTSDMDDVRTRLGDISARIQQTEAVGADLREHLESELAGVQQHLGAGAEAIARIREEIENDRRETAEIEARLVSGLRAADERASSLAARLDETEAEAANAHTSAQHLGAALTRTRERLEHARRDVRNLRERVPSGFLEPLESRVKDLSETSMSTLRMAFETGIQLGRDPRTLVTAAQAKKLFDSYLRKEQYLQLKPLIESFDLLPALNLSTLRSLYRFYRAAGYWGLALSAVETLHEKSGRDNDARAAAMLRSEIQVFSEPDLITAELPAGDAYDPCGPILHMVGRVLPETQTGYTLRTQYTAQAQARQGLPVAIVGQAGITGRDLESIEEYAHQGIDYFLLPGPARNQALLEDWLKTNMLGLAELVRQKRPSILHAQSDFFNALIVSAVGKHYGIPTVYESRGFWEESWLSRTITAQQWADPESLFATYGPPEAYALRKHAEEAARLQTDHVLTLAHVMREHIIESAQGALDKSAIAIVPNAVEAQNFPLQERDPELAAQLGIPEGAVTVGYISSIVEYEGIDTLIDAFELAVTRTSTPMYLLVVGDGAYLPTLKQQVESKGLQNVIFTGRVPHEDILRYYGLIDVFVVPRKPSRVSDLVTPLKPFEALATGRAVILSDVGALQEIAEQSAAVETFRAGSSHSLAQALTELVESKERRSLLSVKAAAWVRSHRTWDSNASEYFRVYSTLGYRGPRSPFIDAEVALKERGCDVGTLLSELREGPLPDATGWFSIDEGPQTAEEIVRDGWRMAPYEPVRVTEITDWSRYGKEHRSWGFNLQAWDFMDALIVAYDVSGDRVWLDHAVAIATNWISAHGGEPTVDDTMAWYDMSVALRTPRLISLTMRAARVEALRDETVLFAEALMRHLEELHRDRAFNPGNNHGLYTALAQVHAAKHVAALPGADQARAQGKQRLAQMANSQFASDGVHAEHSPAYHRMLLASFEAAFRDGLIDDEEVQERIRRAAHVLGWMIQPDGTLVQFGDTDQVRVVAPSAESANAHTRYLLTDGERGERPTEELGVFTDGGYAFVRSPQPQGPGELHKSGYVALSAAFHSRAHKHADDLNVVWYDRGQQILVDAGRFGYGELLPPDSPLRGQGFYYATPERQYVESTMAHNTLMVDGRDHERRAREPYGAALEECVEKRGVFHLSGRVEHSDYIHRRQVVYRPGQELLLKDSVFSHVAETREATIWLNIDGSFQLESAGDEIVLVHPQAGLRLTISSDAEISEPVRGQEEPLRGWRSRHAQALEPAWSLALTASFTERASISTYLRLDAPDDAVLAE